MAKIGWTTITAPVVVGTHGGYVAQIKTGDVPASMLSAASTLINGGGNLIAFTDATMTTRLPLEVITCVTGLFPELLVYTRYDGSFVTNTTIYLIADDTQVVQPAVGAAYGRNAVWSDYAYVSHDGGLTESSNGYAMVDDGSGAPTTGQFGHPALTAPRQRPSDTSVADLTSNFTLTAWGDFNGNTDTLISRRDGATRQYQISIVGTDFVLLTTGSTSLASVGAVPATAWSKFTASITSATDIDFYANGVSTGNYNKVSISSQPTIPLRVGYRGNGGLGTIGSATGAIMYEVRVRSSTITANWESTEYDNQSSATWFTNDGWTESGGGFKPYWARSANNLISYN